MEGKRGKLGRKKEKGDREERKNLIGFGFSKLEFISFLVFQKEILFLRILNYDLDF